MNAEVLKKIEEKRLGRRSFLRGSGLAVAAFAGVAAMSTLTAHAQQQAPERPAPKPEEPQTESKEKVDGEGREYRNCPQCGQNMYREGRTWTCENCGYSYVE